MRKYLTDILVLLFLTIFVISSTTIIAILFNLIWWFVFLILFLFGVCIGYIINKGHTSDFVRRGLITGIVISVFIFIYSFYISNSTVNFFSSLYEKLIEIAKDDIRPFIGTIIEYPSPIKISLFSSISVMIGIIVYSFVLEKTYKKLKKSRTR
jgi:asparagine N-glycosylation enzyme membrane subunit Stt3